MAKRFKEEFYCTECKRYFLTYLREDMFGNFTVECPGCGHHHYRVIKKGICTQDRHDRKYELGQSELLMGLPSTLKDTPWHDDPDYKRSQFKLLRS